jgi:hypothetical protein
VWICLVDGENWPCRAARTALTRAYPDPDVLSAHLAWLARVAADDLGLPSPAALYRRFVRWSLPAGACCPVCARAGHVPIAGLPPRLFPCDGHPLGTPCSAIS